MTRWCAMAAVLAALTGAAVTVAAAAGAAQAGTSVKLVSTTMSAMATTNGKVDALAYAKGTVYVGGQFTTLMFRGTRYQRNHLAAVSSATGAPTSFDPDVNGEVRCLAFSRNRAVVFVGGQFTSVGSVARSDVAAFSTSTGALLSFAPKVAGIVTAMAVTSSGVYLGGTITKVNGKRRTYAAEVSHDGTLLPWAPKLDGYVRALLVSPDRTRIFLGGGFHHVNGIAHEALGSVNLTSGANKPFNRHLIPVYRRRGHVSQVTSLTSDGRVIFAGAEGTGKGVFDGTLAFWPRTGRLVWRNSCLGATQAILYLAGVLYKGSHAHDCSRSGGFPQILPGWHAHHLLAQSIATGQLLSWGTTADSLPDPLPDTNGGVGNNLGPFAFATDGIQLFVGGEFTTVNDRPQEGLARFGR